MADTFKEVKLRCTACEWKGRKFLWSYEGPLCDACGAMAEPDDVLLARAPGVIPDSIPGGLDVRHGLCNADGSPRRYYSKTDIKAEAARRGWTISGETPKDPGARWV